MSLEQSGYPHFCPSYNALFEAQPLGMHEVPHRPAIHLEASLGEFSAGLRSSHNLESERRRFGKQIQFSQKSSGSKFPLKTPMRRLPKVKNNQFGFSIDVRALSPSAIASKTARIRGVWRVSLCTANHISRKGALLGVFSRTSSLYRSAR